MTRLATRYWCTLKRKLNVIIKTLRLKHQRNFKNFKLKDSYAVRIDRIDLAKKKKKYTWVEILASRKVIFQDSQSCMIKKKISLLMLR